VDQTITLAGRDWSVPVLAPKQNRVAVPLLLDLLPELADGYRRARVDASDAGRGINRLELLRALAPHYDAMCTIAFTALTRANPELQRDSFDDLAIDTEDLIAAMVPIARAAGVLR